MSPHPGQVKAELNSAPRSAEVSPQAAELSNKIHELLFADKVEETAHG
jgi:NitT/TauT family transport system ATP-binding protein